ncbi:MAG: hypothetical protein R6W94_06030, partial [Spirochaetia bacterium]
MSDSHDNQDQNPSSSQYHENGPDPSHDAENVAATPQPEQYQYDDTVSLLDLIAVIAKRWKLIFFTTFFAAIGIVLFSLYTLRTPFDSPYNPLPNVYRPEAQILLTDPDSSSPLQGALGNADLGLLSGLANMGGQGGTSAALAQELLRGNRLIDQVIEEFNLLEKHADADFPKTAARNSIRESLTSEFDDASGILTVSYESIDPAFAT